MRVSLHSLPVSPYRHSGAGRNPGNEAGELMTVRFYRRRITWPACSGHSRPGGNGLNKPLDSGLRRNDEGWIPAFTGRLRTSLVTCSRPACGGQALLCYLGGLFQTPLYHGSADLAERPAPPRARP